MSVSYFPGNWSECGSSGSTGPTLDFPKQPSIESFFPAYKSESETDGSTISESNKTTLAAAQLLSYSIESFFPAYKSESETDGSTISESNKTTLAAAQLLSYSIESFFPAYKSESSVSNEPTPDFSKQLSIPSFFPPGMSESDTNENYETQFSYSIVSFFPPARSLTDSSQYYEIIPTHTSIATTIDSVGYILDKFWSSQSVPILDLNSSESSLDPLTTDSSLEIPSLIAAVVLGLLALVRHELRHELYEVHMYLRIHVLLFLLRHVSYMPLRYLRWLKKSLLKRTIAISSTTQK